MLGDLLRMLVIMLADDNAGNALVEYAIVAAAVALPLLGIGYAIASSSGSGLSSMTTNLSNLGVSPP
jgi:Flp pilus assembly pilin Flp